MENYKVSYDFNVNEWGIMLWINNKNIDFFSHPLFNRKKRENEAFN